MIYLTVSNPEFARKDLWLFDQPEFFEFSGQEVAVKHVGADSIALSTGNPEWPVRVIARNRIVKLNGQPYSYSAAAMTKTVKGSKGEQYLVTLGARPHCTCTGFQFRKTCKHIL